MGYMILQYHTNPLNSQLHYIHGSSLRSSSLPSACQLQKV